MLLASRLLVVATLALAAAAAGSQLSPRVLHESRSFVPAGWTPVRRATGFRIPLKIGLTQPNLASIEEHLMDVSHPESANYGNHWSPAKVAQTFRPTQDSVDTVRTWLHQSGIEPDRVKMAGGWLTADVTIEEAEELLGTEYYVYEHENGATHVGCDKKYHLPEHVSKHVDLITPTIHFDARVKREYPGQFEKRQAKNVGAPGFGPVNPKTTGTIKSVIDELSHCDNHTTPNCLRALYDFVYYPLAPEKNSIGIVEYTPQAYSPTDLDVFFKNFSSSQIGHRPNMVSIDGGTINVNGSGFVINGESNLDLQFAMALVGKEQPVTLYQVGDPIAGASFNNFLNALDGSYCTFEGGNDPSQDAVYPDPAQGGYKGKEDCGIVAPAKVISTSYSYDEWELTPAYMQRQCAEYAKLGLMGTTVLYSSGDYGVGGYNNTCLLPDGTAGAGGKTFAPSFPGGCPYVTSVGATQVNPGAKVTDPESACEQVIYSGGGFSNVFKMPDYQKNAVNDYLSKYPPPYSTDLWNNTGSRGYPDLSANGANYPVAIQGEFYLVYGTSASSPVMAAILSAVNDARLALGKGSIGFINPTIYSDAFRFAFNDITNGTNPGCGTKGFSAQPGWDPVTGVGTPNFVKLLALWLLLP